MDESRYEIRLSGSGGQGLILAGIILGEAAVAYDGKNAVQTQSYGPESRGGASKSEVVISSDAIDYPKVIQPDLLLAMTQEACDKYAGDVKPEGIVILDSMYVQNWPQDAKKVYSVPLTAIAKDKTGKAITANIVAVGVITAMTGVVSREAAEEAVLKRVPAAAVEANKAAFQAGLEAGDEVRSVLA